MRENNAQSNLAALGKAGLRERYGIRNPEQPANARERNILERLKYEISLIEKSGFAGDFLVIRDAVLFAREKDIPIGPGRGRLVGSLAAYVLGITGVDPIRHDLVFGHFLTPDRIFEPHLAMDTSPVRRREIIGYLKERHGRDNVDVCGMKALAVIDMTLAMIKQAKGIAISIDHIPLDDGPAMKIFWKGDTQGVFQFGSMRMRMLASRLRPDCFEDIIAMISLFRPGRRIAQWMNALINRKTGKQATPCLHPRLEAALSSTRGLMIYQEQIAQAAHILAGYTLAMGDILCRTLRQSHALCRINDRDFIELTEGNRRQFIEGCQTTAHIPADAASEIFAEMAERSCYCFNKAHAAGYAMIAYRMAWLKAHYPDEFASALSPNLRRKPT